MGGAARAATTATSRAALGPGCVGNSARASCPMPEGATCVLIGVGIFRVEGFRGLADEGLGV